MELCLVINLTKGGTWTILWLPIFATGFVSYATTFYTRARGYKTFFMLNSVEHEFLNANKYNESAAGIA